MLRDWCIGTAAGRNLPARTGALSWASLVSGYRKTAAGEHRAFYILPNRYDAPSHSRSTRQTIDSVVLMLVNLSEISKQPAAWRANPGMKKCTWCGRTYADEATQCLVDQQPLAACNSITGKIPESEGAIAFRKHVIIPGGLYLLLFVLLVASFRWGVYFLSLITAAFAALDAAKYRERGTRVLGISFKPVVVFAVCAFFFFGVGFIWYLFLRHKLLTTKLEPEMEHGGEEDDSPPKPVTLTGGKFPWEI